MSFSRDNTLNFQQNGDTVKQAITKLDDDMTKIYGYTNTVNTLTSQKISQTEKGSTNGVCPLDSDSKILITYFPDEGKIPVGTVLMYCGTTAPSGYFECDGASYECATYSNLFDVLGYSFGGSGTEFCVPDCRGFFVRGWNHGSGNDPDALTRTGGDVIGSIQGFATKKHAHPTGGNTGKGSGGESVIDPGSAWGNSVNRTSTLDFQRDTTELVSYYSSYGTDSYAGGTETRPKNIAMMFIIKY